MANYRVMPPWENWVEPGLHIDAIEERFLIHGRMEILALLNELIYCGEPVSVHFGKSESLTTRLLEAREHTVVFEAGDDQAINERLAAAADCTVLACPQGVRVLFAGDQPKPVLWGSCAAFSVSLPARVARVQRQESFRTIVPPRQGPDVALFAQDGSPLGSGPLRDLSVGGIGVDLPNQAELSVAAATARARLNLPGYGEVDCAVSVRHVTTLTQPEGDPAFRIGLGFSALPEPMRIAIQRYIVDVEHERRSTALPGPVED